MLLSAPSGPRRSPEPRFCALPGSLSHLWGSREPAPAPTQGHSFSGSSADEADKSLQTPGTASGEATAGLEGASGPCTVTGRRHRRCFCENAAWPWFSVALNRIPVIFSSPECHLSKGGCTGGGQALQHHRLSAHLSLPIPLLINTLSIPT